MKKLNLIAVIVLFAQFSSAQHHYFNRGMKWLERNNQCQIEAKLGYNFLQEKNEFRVPVDFGLNAQFEYQLGKGHLIGFEVGTRSSYIKKSKIIQHFDEGSHDYRDFSKMTEGNNSSMRIGLGYSKVFKMNACFLKMSIYGGLNSTTKKKHEIDIFDNTQGGITDYREFISTGNSSVSGYSKLHFSFGVPVGQDIAVVFGPRIYATTPTTIRNEYMEVENGYLQYANVNYTASSILSLDFTIGIVFSLNQY